MTTILADSFTASLARLSNDEQKQAKLTAFDLQLNPDQPGLQFHRIDKSKDPNFWSVRVSRDVRLIVHKTRDSLMLVHVGHHDDAYDWARRRRIEAHPTTGALQIVEVRELVEDIAVAPVRAQAELPLTAKAPPLFVSIGSAELLAVGVPEDWLADVHAATENDFFALADHLPREASEALLEYAATGSLPAPPSVAIDPLTHPDALRRFRVLDGIDELRAALDAPFETWAVFLHPSQQAIVSRRYSGPARIVGSAGTGKTVVALHRVASLLRSEPDARVLLTTFSEPLSRMLSAKLRVLLGDRPGFLDRVTIGSFEQIAAELYALATGRDANRAAPQLVRNLLRKAADDADVTEVSSQFLNSEWDNVVDAWQIDSAKAYAEVPRMGRKTRLGPRQRQRLWAVFDAVRKDLASRRLVTEAGLFAASASLYRDRDPRPFTHIVVDEAQDLGVAELRFLSAIAPRSDNALFFAGDLGQRIFRQPFSWMKLGVDVRGRSATLKVNYRTSHQIRRAADRLLPRTVSDVDGLEDARFAAISVFEGPEPEIVLTNDEVAEQGTIAKVLEDAIAKGASPQDIAVFVRSESELARARAAVRTAGLRYRGLVDAGHKEVDTVLVGTMHLAKGLEFRMVVLMACDEGVLPLAARVAEVADAFELEEVLRTERQLLYVAATRARDRLVVSAVKPGSEFLGELSA